MKKFFKNLKVALAILSVLVALIYMSIHLSGIWKITIGNIHMSFDNCVTMGMFWAYASFGWRDWADNFLSTRDAEYEYERRKQYRRSLRLILRAVWILVFGVIFALGQANHWHDAYEYLGGLGLLDLGIVIVCGIIFATVIPMPEDPNNPDRASLEADSLNSSML